MFKIYSFNQRHSVPLVSYPITDEEAYVQGQVMKRDGDLLTAADETDAGTQEFVTISSGTGDGSTRVAVVEIQRQHNYIIDSANVAGTAAVGSTYELNTDLDGITNTTTNGVFTADKIFDNDDVVGHFTTVYDR